MGLHVAVQVALLGSSEGAAWVGAHVGLLPGVGAHVHCKVVHPGKAGGAALLSAPVGLLPSMKPLVLLQVAPFTGHKLAPGVAASARGPGAGVDAAVHCQVGLALAGKPTARFRASEGSVAWV